MGINASFEQTFGNGQRNRIWRINISLESEFCKEIKYILQIMKQAAIYNETVKSEQKIQLKSVSFWLKHATKWKINYISRIVRKIDSNGIFTS